MTFDRPDPEYLDGELVERHLGDIKHSATQKKLMFALQSLERDGKVLLFPELHLRTSASGYQVADLAIFLEQPAGRIPSLPPCISIEIVSPDDSLSGIRGKSEEYRAWSVRHIWLVDPNSCTFTVYESGIRDVERFQLPELGFELTPEQVFG